MSPTALRTLPSPALRPALQPAVQAGARGAVTPAGAAVRPWPGPAAPARPVRDPGFTLFETLLAHGGRGLRQASAHLARLRASAQALGFAFDEQALHEQLAQALAGLPAGRCGRVRLELAHDGQALSTLAPVQRFARGARVKLALAEQPLPAAESALLAHKTSLRSVYDGAIAAAEAAGAFDTLFFNRHGHLTEGGRCNVFVRVDGRWWTPPVASGLLPGLKRARLLASCACAGERVLSAHDLARAQDLLVRSALRGISRAELLHPLRA